MTHVKVFLVKMEVQNLYREQPVSARVEVASMDQHVKVISILHGFMICCYSIVVVNNFVKKFEIAGKK